VCAPQFLWGVKFFFIFFFTLGSEFIIILLVDSMTDCTTVLVIFAIICCAAIVITAIVTPIVVVRSQEACSTSASFADLPAQYYVDEQYLSYRATSNVVAADSTVIGSYATRPSVASSQYTYHDTAGDVVAQIEKSLLSWTYTITRCSGAGSTYTVSRTTIFALTSIEYNLARDGVVIGYPDKQLLFQCKPDVVIVDVNNSLLATIDRSCLGSFFTDHWNVTNHNPAVVESYVLGAIAYFITQEENAAEAKSPSKH
jgi:hypothetical protein